MTEEIERFTVGRDREMDLYLAKYDVLGSMAHITMLESIGLLEADELKALLAELRNIYSQAEQGKFVIEEGVEDVHSQVEMMLTRKLGDMGKKIHSGRSRNDQVLVDLKLFIRDQIKEMAELVQNLFGELISQSNRYKDVLMPGYTHLQVAMPSSFGLWFGAYAEALADDMYMLRGAYNVTDQNPLGSAAGYGSSFPLDRQMTTDLLEFGSLDYNVVAAQLSRGKSERAVASAMGAIALTLNKFAADCCMYMSPNYGFIKFPDELTTGSSIMPHKKNPDVWEIMRGNCNRIMATENEISMLCSNMPHGYHREFQLLKDILFPALELMHKCLMMADYMLQHIIVKEGILDAPIYDYLFTVEEVNRRTLDGMPFRDAYRTVGIEVNEGRFRYQGAEGKTNGQLAPADLNHTSLGSLGNLCTDRIRAKMDKAAEF
jgi:argininosuccinate lyase